MKKNICIYRRARKMMLLFTSIPVLLFAQDTTQTQTSTLPEEPVKETFESPWLINNQTVEGTAAHALTVIMQHRFGNLVDGTDLYGIYAAAANIRIGLNYGITNRLSIGAGVAKNNMLYDLEWKYILLKQKPGAMPVTVTYYGNAMRSASPKTGFINQAGEYQTFDRLSFFNELMIARKINDNISLQVSASYTHLNIVDSTQKNDILGVSFVGRYKFSVQSSVQVEFDYPITIQPDNLYSQSQKPNLGIGYEVSTGNHQFQIFLCTANNIAGQQIMAFNVNDFTKKQYLIGFNITRVFD